MCKVNLFCLPLGFASFPSEHQDSITSSVFEGYTQAHILTYAQLTDTNTVHYDTPTALARKLKLLFVDFVQKNFFF